MMSNMSNAVRRGFVMARPRTIAAVPSQMPLNIMRPTATQLLGARAFSATATMEAPRINMADLSNTNSYSQRVHSIHASDDPNAAIRDNPRQSAGRLMKDKTGLHKANGKAKIFRDSAPGLGAFLFGLLGVIPMIGWYKNWGPTATGGYQIHQILRRQTDCKKEFGKGGGGLGTGPSSAGYDQKRAELGTSSKIQTKNLLPGQPTRYKMVNDYEVASFSGLVAKLTNKKPESA